MNTSGRFFLVVVAIFFPISANATEYTFSKLYSFVDTSQDSYDTQGVALNDNGLVAVFDQMSLYTTNGSVLTTIASPIGPNTVAPYQVFSLNNNGYVAFHTEGNWTILASNGTTTRTIAASSTMGGTFSDFPILGAMSIDDSGMVAFEADRSIFIGNGITDATDIGLAFGCVPAINNSGMIAYQDYGSSTSQRFIKIQNGTETHSLPDATDGMAMPDLNELGTVAYFATVDGIRKIAIGDGISQTTYIDGSAYKGGLTGGLWIDGGIPDCAINNQGTVAFGACVTSQGVGYGIFTGADPTADKVIMEGDALNNATVTDLFFARNGLNNKGQIAFTATLSDGTSGVFVATPIPEPSALILLVIGTLSLLGYVWRSRRRAA